MKRNKVERKRLCLLSKYIITLIENNYMEMHKSSQQKKINEVKKKGDICQTNNSGTLQAGTIKL